MSNWADPLNRDERDELARMLARHCKRSHEARKRYYGRRNLRKRVAMTLLSYEFSELHLDVTERAGVASQ